MKLEQQQKQGTNDIEQSSINSNTPATTITPALASTVPVPVLPVSDSSQATNTTRTSVGLSSESFDSPEEEINWITISRKQSKHKPSPSSVPSLLAAPVPPVVVPPTNTKQHRQQQTTANTKKAAITANAPSLAQQKVIPPSIVTSSVTLETPSATNKQQHTTVAPVRRQNLLNNHVSHQPQKLEPSIQPQAALQPPLNLWTNNHLHEHTIGTRSAQSYFQKLIFFEIFIIKLISFFLSFI